MTLLEEVRKEYRDETGLNDFYRNMVRDGLLIAAKNGKKVAKFWIAHDLNVADTVAKYLRNEGFEVEVSVFAGRTLIEAKF